MFIYFDKLWFLTIETVLIWKGKNDYNIYNNKKDKKAKDTGWGGVEPG